MKTLHWFIIVITVSIIASAFYLQKKVVLLENEGVDTSTQVEMENPTEGSSGAGNVEGEGSETTLSPTLLSIAECESGDRQFNDDGTLVRGKVNPYDIGRFQINELYHGERAEELGIDLYTYEGNTEFALLLYNEQGTTPWNWSKSCWG